MGTAKARREGRRGKEKALGKEREMALGWAWARAWGMAWGWA